MSKKDQILVFPKEGIPTLVSNDWHIWYGEQKGGTWTNPEWGAQKTLVPFSWWCIHSDSHPEDTELMSRAQQGQIGVWFAADDDVLQHADMIQVGKSLWSVVAVHFPIFRDGRSFSTAALLRDRFTWHGEIRAIGDVLIDQLLQGARVGLDAFDLRSDQDIETALRQFDLFSVTTQNSWRSKRTLLASYA